MNRKKFLALSTATASSFLFSQCTSQSSKAQSNLPQQYISNGGLLEVVLTTSMNTVSLSNQTVNRLSYNGKIPGPTLEARPGDTVRIHFINQLQQPTNLHYHGLHIPPTNNADNVFISVPPGETFTYEFNVPKNHPAGTFGYHPHRHGLVADQLFGGLAGLFIIRGELDNIPEIAAAQEQFLVLQDFNPQQSRISHHERNEKFRIQT